MKKKRKKMRDDLDDNDRKQVEPRPERPDEMQDETWARPGDEDKPEQDLPQVTNVKVKKRKGL